MTIRVLLCQLKVRQKRNYQRAWVEYEEAQPQLERCWALVEEHKPDLVVLPETCYFPQIEDTYRQMAADGRLVVAGSAYSEASVNETHIFAADGSHCALPKIFPSPKEIMELNHPNRQVADVLIAEWEAGIKAGRWPDYFPLIDAERGRRIAVLTCMDYYRLGYYVANSSVMSPHVWGLVSPSSNPQQEIFLRLAEAVHDANERVYSMVLNSHNESRVAGSSQGESFVLGPITPNVKAMLEDNGQENPHFSFIYQLGEAPEALMMDLIDGEDVRFFARSKDFFSNPTNIRAFSLV